MMLWPQAWPMPGSASYSHSTAIVGPSDPARAANAVSSPGAPLDGEALALEDAGEQVVGEVLLEAQLGVGVDLVRRLDQHVGQPVDLGDHPVLHRFDLGSHAATLRIAQGLRP